ncbi:MATH domain-containing protein [Psidium guajava]|nr:MATH domain-containing protein [Psidium guajava]
MLVQSLKIASEKLEMRLTERMSRMSFHGPLQLSAAHRIKATRLLLRLWGRRLAAQF